MHLGALLVSPLFGALRLARLSAAWRPAPLSASSFRFGSRSRRRRPRSQCSFFFLFLLAFGNFAAAACRRALLLRSDKLERSAPPLTTA